MFNQKKDSNMLQTRIAQRRDTSAKGLYKILDRNRYYARSYLGAKAPMALIDISTTGCAFKVGALVPKGSYIEIELRNLSEEHVFDPPVTAACEAVYCRYLDRNINRVGVKFLEIHRNDTDRIRTYTE